jgi:hypothetical protein
MRLPAALVLALATASAGCGKSKDAQLFDDRKAACENMVLDGTVTSRIQSQSYSQTPDNGGCPQPGQKLNKLANDKCDYDKKTICFVTWEWIAPDRNNCSPFGCIYGCEARFAGTPGDLLVNDGPICGTRWYSGQP